MASVALWAATCLRADWLVMQVVFKTMYYGTDPTFYDAAIHPQSMFQVCAAADGRMAKPLGMFLSATMKPQEMVCHMSALPWILFCPPAPPPFPPNPPKKYQSKQKQRTLTYCLL